MKHIFTGFNLVGALALLALAVGCASYQVRTTESLLSEAGFQTRIPSTPAQLAMYNQMTPYKLERNTFKGKSLYSYADKQKGVAYIGGEKRINATSNLRLSSTRWRRTIARCSLMKTRYGA
jgi:hypothetical protein